MHSWTGEFYRAKNKAKKEKENRPEQKHKIHTLTCTHKLRNKKLDAPVHPGRVEWRTSSPKGGILLPEKDGETMFNRNSKKSGVPRLQIERQKRGHP